MIVFFGSRNYGKVDHVPGLFYVVTGFFYIQFIPLFPTGSILVLDDGKERGFKLGMSGKSIFFAYLRAALIIGGPAAILFGVLELMKNPPVSIGLIIVGVVATVFFFLSYKLAKPSPQRALRLANQAGIPPEYVAQFFVHAEIPADMLAQPHVDDVLPADDR
jgi:hypothetical protein